MSNAEQPKTWREAIVQILSIEEIMLAAENQPSPQWFEEGLKESRLSLVTGHSAARKHARTVTISKGKLSENDVLMNESTFSKMIVRRVAVKGEYLQVEITPAPHRLLRAGSRGDWLLKIGTTLAPY